MLVRIPSVRSYWVNRNGYLKSELIKTIRLGFFKRSSYYIAIQLCWYTERVNWGNYNKIARKKSLYICRLLKRLGKNHEFTCSQSKRNSNASESRISCDFIFSIFLTNQSKISAHSVINFAQHNAYFAEVRTKIP